MFLGGNASRNSTSEERCDGTKTIDHCVQRVFRKRFRRGTVVRPCKVCISHQRLRACREKSFKPFSVRDEHQTEDHNVSNDKGT